MTTEAGATRFGRTEGSGSRRIAVGPLDGADLIFVGLLVLGAVLVLAYTRSLSFFGDDWDFVVQRRGLAPATLLRPHGPHLSLVPILIYKVLLKLFNGHYFPFRMLAALDLVLLAGTLRWAVQPYFGRWGSLIPTALLVTLGPAGSSLLWSFQCGYSISTAAGLVALILLNRESGRRDDLLASILLIISLGAASQGIGFVVGAIVLLAVRRQGRRIGFALIPAFLYAVWYLAEGHRYSESQLSLWNGSLQYAWHSLGATLAALLGLSSVNTSTGLLDLSYAPPLALAAVAGAAVALYRGWRPPALFWAGVVTAAVLWFASSISDTAVYSRPPEDPRYLATNAFLVLFLVCLVIPAPRLSRAGAAVVAVVIGVIGLFNIPGYSASFDSMRASDSASRAALGAALIMRNVMPPDFPIGASVPPALLTGVTSTNFLSAESAFGDIPADTPQQIAALDPATRTLVDQELASAEVALQPAPQDLQPASGPPAVLAGRPETRGNCVRVGAALLTLRSAAGEYELHASSRLPMTVVANRFGISGSVSVGTIAARTSSLITVHGDGDPGLPWHISTTGTGGTICSVTGG